MNRPLMVENDDDCIFVEVVKRGSPSVLCVNNSLKENQNPNSPRHPTPTKRSRPATESSRVLQRSASPIVVSGVVMQKSDNGKVFIRSKSSLLARPEPEIIWCNSSSDDDDDLEIIKVLGGFSLPPKQPAADVKDEARSQPTSQVKSENKIDSPANENASTVLDIVNQKLELTVRQDNDAISQSVEVTLKKATESIKIVDAPTEAVATVEPNAAPVEQRRESSPLRLPIKVVGQLPPDPAEPVAKLEGPLSKMAVASKPTPKHVYENIIQRYAKSIKAPFAAVGGKVVSLDDDYLGSMLMAHFNSSTKLEHLVESLELVAGIINVGNLIDLFSCFGLVEQCFSYFARHMNKFSDRSWLVFFRRLGQLCEFADASEIMQQIRESTNQQELTGLSKELEQYWQRFLKFFKRLFESLVGAAEELIINNELHALYQTIVALSLGLFAKFSQLVFAFKRAFAVKNTNWLLNADKNSPFYLETTYFSGMMLLLSKVVTKLLNNAEKSGLRFAHIIKSMQQFLMLGLHCGCLNSQKTRTREIISTLKKIHGEIGRVEDRLGYLSHLVCFEEMRKRVCVELLIEKRFKGPGRAKTIRQSAGMSASDWEHAIILENVKKILDKKDLNGSSPETAEFEEYLNMISIYLSDPLKQETQLYQECFDAEFEDLRKSTDQLRDSIGELLRLKTTGVANLLNLAPEFVFLAQTVS